MHSLQSLLVYFLAFVSFGQAITYNGADFSSLALLEASGTHYSDSGSSSSDFVTIMASHGANLARIRIWTSTSSSQYSLTYGLALAKRAASAGMALLIDLHYSDTCKFIRGLFSTITDRYMPGADPGKQAIPSSWPTTLSGLNTEIYTSVQVSYAYVSKAHCVFWIPDTQTNLSQRSRTKEPRSSSFRFPSSLFPMITPD